MSLMTRITGLLADHVPDFLRDRAVTYYSRRRGAMKFGPRFHDYLTDLDRTQWYDNARLQELQDEKLRRLIHYVNEHVPFHRERFAELGLAPDDIRTAADLSKLPTMAKADLQAHGDRLRSEIYRDDKMVEIFKSSGTTGRPVAMAVSHDYLQMEKAYTYLHRRWGGIGFRERTAAFVGFPVVPYRKKSPPFWAHDRWEDRMMFSLQHMTARNMPAYAEALADLQPVLIYGYPTAIYLMAMHLNDGGDRRVRPRAIFTASETLLPHQRAEMEQAFGCRVFDWYGASEMTANIVQCAEGNYHIKAEYGVVEILKDDGEPAGPGEQGTLVGTGLNNLATPLLRYRMGDSAVFKGGVCPCGRGGELVERIVGRVEDVIVTSDGRWLSRLDFIFKGLDMIEEAQLVQEEAGAVRVRIVKRRAFADGDEARILKSLKTRLGDDMRISLEYLDRIPRTRNGKFRYVISKLSLGSAGRRQTGEFLDRCSEEEATL